MPPGDDMAGGACCLEPPETEANRAWQAKPISKAGGERGNHFTLPVCIFPQTYAQRCIKNPNKRVRWIVDTILWLAGTFCQTMFGSWVKAGLLLSRGVHTKGIGPDGQLLVDEASRRWRYIQAAG